MVHHRWAVIYLKNTTTWLNSCLSFFTCLSGDSVNHLTTFRVTICMATCKSGYGTSVREGSKILHSCYKVPEATLRAASFEVIWEQLLLNSRDSFRRLQLENCYNLTAASVQAYNWNLKSAHGWWAMALRHTKIFSRDPLAIMLIIFSWTDLLAFQVHWPSEWLSMN